MPNDNLWIYPGTTDPHRIDLEGLEAVFAHLSDAAAALTHALEGLEDRSPESLTSVNKAWMRLDDMMKQAHETMRTETNRQMQESEERHAASQRATTSFILLFMLVMLLAVAGILWFS